MGIKCKFLWHGCAIEIRKYRANFVGNYSFSEGRIKGTNLGTAFRW